MPNISTVIKSIQDIMRKDTGVDGDAQRLSQLVWMLFLKLFEDREKEYELKDNYISPIPQGFRWKDWAENDEGITGDELIDFINNKLFPKFKNLYNPHDIRAGIIKEIFEDTYNYMKSGHLLRQVINKINEIDFNSSEDSHLFNDIYENLLRSLQSAGNAGEYYTPRAVTQFMVDMVDPQFGEIILDPACGTGGFLSCALEYIRKNNEKRTTDQERELQNSIIGVEKKPLPHQLCVTNMILHGIEAPVNITRENTLAKSTNEINESNRVHVILTNPPFGGMEEDGIEKSFPTGFQTRETADLFLYYIIKRLRKHGRAGIVLPDGSLFGEGVKTKIKEELLGECNLHTIVRLPNGVFNPYTGIKTNLLFFAKGESTKEVWYFEHPLPETIKNYSRSNPLTIEEFELEKSWWNNREDEQFSQYAWKVSIDEIKARNYNLDFKNPKKEIYNHKEPEVLLTEYKDVLKDLADKQNELKSELASILR